MKVMVIVKASRASEAGEMPSQQLMTEMVKFNEQLAAAGIMLAGEGLHPSSKGVRVAFSGKNRTATDGPFAETKELIAGFWLWKLASMAEAVEWVKRCPNPHDEPCEIEIRQVFSADDFGAEFTPELREQEAAIRAKSIGLETPRFENGREFNVAGFNEKYTGDTRMNIPKQWDRFAPQLGKVPGQVDQTAYGVCWNFTPNCGFDYLTGVEVAGSTKLPAEFKTIKLMPHRYIVFTHKGHISSLPNTLTTIHKQWEPDCGLKLAQAPMFERYTDKFDPKTGTGEVEIWVPLEG